jgi:hypothetical protein
MLWVVTPRLIESGRDPMKCITFILVTFLVQYLPKVVHTALMVRRLQHVTGYIFGTASSGFFLNLLAYFISAHVSFVSIIFDCVGWQDFESVLIFGRYSSSKCSFKFQ